MACTSNAFSAYSSYAVTKTTAGTCSAPSCWMTPNPSHAGICTSRNTRSGCCCWIADTACVPSAYSPTTSMSFSWFNSPTMRSRATGSSSTTTVRILVTPPSLVYLGHGLGLSRFLTSKLRHRNGDAHEQTALGGLPEFKPVQRPVQVIESRPGIREPDAAVEVGQPGGRQADAVVLHVEFEQGAVAAGAHGDLPRRGPGTNAVLDGVFDERLQQKVGDQRVQRLGLDVEYHRQTIAEPRLFDFQVLREEIELLLQRHFLHAHALQRHAEQIAQPRDHRVGGVDIAMHQRRNGVQRVEQKVRLHLALQGMQPRFNEPRFKLHGAELLGPRFVHVLQRRADADDGPVGHHLPVEVQRSEERRV